MHAIKRRAHSSSHNASYRLVALGQRGKQRCNVRLWRAVSLCCNVLLLIAFAFLGFGVLPLSRSFASAHQSFMTSTFQTGQHRAVVQRAGGGASDELHKRKCELIELCDDFRAKQEDTWDMMDKEKQLADAAGGKGSDSKSSLLEAESFAAQQTQLTEELGSLREKIVDAISRIAAQNPTPEPLRGWRGFGDASPSECMLNGTWKLLFTDAADATFRKGKRGAANTFQEIDAATGWFVNCVDFSNPDNKLKGFRVFVEGDALSSSEIQLSFRKVRLLRRSRFPKLFGQITIPLPNPALLRNLGKFFARAKDTDKGVNPSNRGAGFKLLYIDQDLRIHRTFDGLYFVQRRLS